MEDYSLPHQLITDWGIKAFMKCGVPEGDAATITKALVKTSLWGVDSHGIARITHYLGRFQNGTLNNKPALTFDKTAAATGQLNGDDGHGIVIMREATAKAIELAKDAGTGVVGVFNSSHCGAIGLYTRQITESGMVGIAFTHADALVVPHGGNKPFFGTNPISIAFPSEDNDRPICVDMATSIVPWNYMMNAKREKATVPSGLGVDKDGNDSQVAEDIVAIKPMAEHKGYALAFLIDMLCGPLNGMNYGPNMTSMYKDLDKKRKLGSLVIAIDPARFGGKDTIRMVGTAIINQVRGHGDSVLFPGQPEYMSMDKRMVEGIPVSQAIIDDFNNWSDRLGISPILNND